MNNREEVLEPDVGNLCTALKQKCPCGATEQSQVDECAYVNCAAAKMGYKNELDS